MKPFREIAPIRTYTVKHSNYRDYKPYLAKDFHYKCGYTDCSDFWFGGRDNFHIDHFIPWKKYPDNPNLKTDYANLVYSCAYVNIAKSDDEGLYLDPCNVDYNKHFQREDDGKIVPLTENAQYMYSKMKLHFERYGIIWLLDQLKIKMDLLQETVEICGCDAVKELYLSLSFEYCKYEKYLKRINSRDIDE